MKTITNNTLVSQRKYFKSKQDISLKPTEQQFYQKHDTTKSVRNLILPQFMMSKITNGYQDLDLKFQTK
jgi:hypothetical protein